MNIIIYNPNSFGGNFEYSKYLFKYYLKNPDVKRCTLLMPANAAINDANVKKILCSDSPFSQNKIVRKLHFLYRIILNPFIVFFFLLSRPSSVFIFNDYEQLSAFIWVPFFRLLKRRHHFAVILHDPDRDHYFSTKALSEMTMKHFMSLMDIAFHHGFLPHKKYYSGHFLKIAVPHGIYDNPGIDQNMLDYLKKLASGSSVMGILGNIRDEKNYEIVIDSLMQLDNVKLLVAGKASNSNVSVMRYKEYARKRGVADNIIWVEQYLTQTAFNAAIEFCDVVLLYYKSSFTSQSGVLNSIAPFAKKLIISDSKSSLRDCVEKYNLAKVIPNNDLYSLVEAITELIATPESHNYSNWKKYINESSWESHVNIALSSFRKIGCG